MNSFATVVFCLAVATASAGHLGYGLASGSVGVSADGVVIAGPSGSVRTDNGIHGHGAGAVVSGPAGEVRSLAGHAQLTGPGVIAPVAHYAQPIAHQAVIAGPASHTTIVGARSSAVLVTPSAHHGVYAASPLASVYGAAPVWGHSGVVASHGWVATPTASTWGNHGIVGHGLVQHGAVYPGHGVHGQAW